MAIWCARYLNSRPFALGDDHNETEKNFLDGYYGFLDYAAANWWIHIKQLEELFEKSGLPPEGTSRVMHRLASALNQHCGAVEAEETKESITRLQERIRSMPRDGRDWEDAFPIESRVQTIRNCIETRLSKDQSDTDKLLELYGRLSYKCPKPWCQHFTYGFSTPNSRHGHVKEHERPLRCDFDGCYGQDIGFSTHSEFSKHNTRVHLEETAICIPTSRQ